MDSLRHNACSRGGAPRVQQFNSAGYPLNPDAMDCSFYMKNRLCKYAATCKFNHPELDGAVPASEAPAIADSPSSADRAAPAALNTQGYPLRPGRLECAAYSRSGVCPYGVTCKYDHPTFQLNNSAGYPLRQSATDCSFYMTNKYCKFGTTCKFNHPEMADAINAALAPGAHTTASAQSAGRAALGNSLGSLGAYGGVSPLMMMGLSQMGNAGVGLMMAQAGMGMGMGQAQQQEHPPVRPGEPDCSYFIKTGVCKFGATCKFNHPLPVRPGAPDCLHYVRTTKCSYGASCKYNHPPLSPPQPGQIPPQRPGEPACAFFIKSGRCNFGQTCKFDHPLGMAAQQRGAQAEQHAVAQGPVHSQADQPLEFRPAPGQGGAGASTTQAS